MAKRTTVTLVDDLSGDPADETVTFGLDGASFEIDLSQNHAGVLRDILADYVKHGRKLGRAPAAASKPSRSGTDRGAREKSTAIREWAKRNGLPVSDRGRISAEVLGAFNAQNRLAPVG